MNEKMLLNMNARKQKPEIEKNYADIEFLKKVFDVLCNF